jgi:Aspartyl protease
MNSTRWTRKHAARMIVAVFLAAPVGAAAAAEVDMLDCSGLPCISVMSENATPLKMLIDTGDAYSVLDINRAKALGLPIVPAKDGSGKPVPGYFFATLKGVKVGQETLGDVKLLAMDIGKDIAAGSFPRADGSIAYTDLKNRLLTLDYRRHRVALSDATTGVACPSVCGAVSYPTFGRKGPPIVVATGFGVNGQDVNVQIDTLYAGTMLIYPTSVSRLGLSSQSTSPRVRTFPYTDGSVDMIEGNAADESFGKKTLLANAPLYFATPKVHLPDGMFDGTVGGGLFAGHVINIDFHANRFWMD